MPLFEYLCGDCSETFTLLQKADVGPGETACPRCGTREVRKMFSTFASKVAGRTEPSGGGHSCPPTGCGCC